MLTCLHGGAQEQHKMRLKQVQNLGNSFPLIQTRRDGKERSKKAQKSPAKFTVLANNLLLSSSVRRIRDQASFISQTFAG